MRQCCRAIGLCKGVFRHDTYIAGTYFSFFFSFSDENSVTDSSASDDSSLGESTHGVPALGKIQTSDRAAALIQKQFRKSFPQKSSSSSALMFEPWSATTVSRSPFEAQPDVNETKDHEDNEDFTEHSEEKEVVSKEEQRSGKSLWGITAIAGTFVGATMISGIMGGSPVDEDDAIAVAALTKASAGGGGGGTGGAGAGGAGGTAGATSAQ
jgi:hypothetical protein